MNDRPTLWQPTVGLARGLTVGGLGIGLALALGRPVLVVLVAPIALASALALAHKPRSEPRASAHLGHYQLYEGQGTTSDLQLEGVEDVETVVRVMAQEPQVAVHPANGAVLAPLGSSVRVDISPRRWGLRRIGGEKVALTSPWAGYRWGPVSIFGREMAVLPAVTPFPRGGEAPQPIGLVGAHRSRRDGDGTEFSSIRQFHSGDRLRRINWRVSLRQGALHVESTRAEEDTALLLIVDAMADFGISGGIDGAESSLDVTMRAAAAISEQYIRNGDRVSLRVLSPLGQWTGYGAGPAHLRRILSLLSSVRPGQLREVAIDQIDFRTTAGTVVVVLSPMMSEELATATVRFVRRGLPVIVIDPLPAGTAPDVWPDVGPQVGHWAWRMRLVDRSHLMAQLASVGCPVVTWDGAATLPAVLRRLARRSQLPRLVRS